MNRAVPVAADPPLEAGTCGGSEDELRCVSDVDCAGGSYGRCNSLSWDDPLSGDSGTFCGCEYSCRTDDDCGPEGVCVPTGVLGEGEPMCLRATCKVDADCPSLECGLYDWTDGCGRTRGIACRDAEVDECRIGGDCPDDQCAGRVDGWTCESVDCAIGRPFVVQAGVRVAPAVERDDWSAEGRPELPADPADRMALAAHWRRVAAFEHASVASFAQFTLQLLALGAPPELLAEAQVAARDEVRHSARAYGLASAYGGVPVGPGALDTTGVQGAVSVEALLRAVVFEACIGETVGAAEAAEAAAACADPVVQSLLEEIARDEARHAALGWATVRWLVAREGPWAARVAAEVVTAALEEAVPAARAPRGLDAYGVLGAEALAAVHASVRRHILADCRDALLAEAA